MNCWARPSGACAGPPSWALRPEDPVISSKAATTAGEKLRISQPPPCPTIMPELEGQTPHPAHRRRRAKTSRKLLLRLGIRLFVRVGNILAVVNDLGRCAEPFVVGILHGIAHVHILRRIAASACKLQSSLALGIHRKPV